MLEERIYTVSEINREVKIILESTFDHITVMGEISNFKAHYSGHWYFSLKDEYAQINCVMWRGNNAFVFFTPQDGMKVIVTGKMNVYEPRGSYQIDVWTMKPMGTGELAIAFENLKRKLAEEGLFDEQFKKPIPRIPEKIGIITSKDGAALRDVLSVIKRRFPIVEVVFVHSAVQGAEASKEIAEALDLMNEFGEVDVIILCRGGGSLEDLWAFNEETTARAIFRSKIPVITGIGHEVDFTITDFVADKRAATPTAAAEIATPRLEELIETLLYYIKEIPNLMDLFITQKKEQLRNEMRSYSFALTESFLRNTQQKFDFTFLKFNQAFLNYFEGRKQHLKRLENIINLSNPRLNLSKGYSIVRQNGKIVTRKKIFKLNTETELEFFDGKVKFYGKD